MIKISEPKWISFRVTGSQLEMSSIRDFLNSKTKDFFCIMDEGDGCDNEGYYYDIDIGCSYKNYDTVIKEINNFIHSK